ncbi:MAG TPA: FGGY family carbohydrate kinase, partial [Cyclobacteriaceae bacterium]|nr:FGGY family carbohydrate kinase [Cyclobacteriaceae bacterium]
GINFSTYGATLVHLDKNGEPVTPLYNYLKPFPEEAAREFARKYGSASNDQETASPFLGMLNSGLQLYWLKYFKPDIFGRIHTTLHFPQYLSYIFTGKIVSEPTSIGCHTKLWDFNKQQYHAWLTNEDLASRFPEIVATSQCYQVKIKEKHIKVGVGIHDSSAALTSYFQRADKAFVLISTGTWSIALNPFTSEVLTLEDLNRDCLNYLSITGSPVRASRLFLGNELDHQLAVLNKLFGTAASYYKEVKLNSSFLRALGSGAIDCQFCPATINNPGVVDHALTSTSWDPSVFSSFDEAYHHVMLGLVKLQVESVRLALGQSKVNKIFIDGGFIENDLYIQLLHFYLRDFDIEISDRPLGSAYGAALILDDEKVRAFQPA